MVDGPMRPLGEDVTPGARVKVGRDSRWNGPWPSEPRGVIHPEADCPINVIELSEQPGINVEDEDRGPMRELLVLVDEPQFDGDGDGPYYAAVIWEKYLRLVD